jgi:8-oxo-dGTP diphosphatase
MKHPCITGSRAMASKKEYPERPVVAVGGVIIDAGRTVLIRRGTEPLKGQWSIPGGSLELGELLEAGVARELLEETGIQVQVLGLIEVFDRIYYDVDPQAARSFRPPRFHYVIVDYLCRRIAGELHPGSDVIDAAFVSEGELDKYDLTPTASRVLKKAFAMDRAQPSTR